MPSAPDPRWELLRHTLATLAYRARKALAGAPPEFAGFRPGPASRTPIEILAHMGDLFDWALQLCEGRHVFKEAGPGTWETESARFFAALAGFDAFLAGDQALGSTAEKLFQGPIADAFTHLGQISYLRRLAAAPVKGENYFKAEIAAGRVGTEQAAPVYEFD